MGVAPVAGRTVRVRDVDGCTVPGKDAPERPVAAAVDDDDDEPRPGEAACPSPAEALDDAGVDVPDAADSGECDAERDDVELDAAELDEAVLDAAEVEFEFVDPPVAGLRGRGGRGTGGRCGLMPNPSLRCRDARRQALDHHRCSRRHVTCTNKQDRVA